MVPPYLSYLACFTLTPCVLFCYLIGALVTNRVLCLVPLVAWFEDWMFVRKFQMLDIVYVTIEVVGRSPTANIISKTLIYSQILFDKKNIIG